MNIWAHRGCSQMYPENTLTAFEKAMNIPGIAGIELDVQITRDGELVVIHDERVDRTTDGYGFVRDYSLSELKKFHIYTGTEKVEQIPTMREVLDLLQPKLKAWSKEPSQPDGTSKGLRLNIELKNSIYDYPQLEEKIVEMVHEYGVQDAIVYSTFYADSLYQVHKLDPKAELGVLDTKVSDCLYKALGLEDTFRLEEDSAGANADTFTFALHPYGFATDIAPERFKGRTVRGWFGGHLFPEQPSGRLMDFAPLEKAGVTDVFLNEPERYLL
ncbi:MAG: hypothetical protein K6C96_07465 [Butyrivibrio sp.]|nr:hypothetical protein [Butyrivibrio sp.]